MKCLICGNEPEEIFATDGDAGICEACIPVWVKSEGAKPVNSESVVVKPKRKVVSKPKARLITEAKFRKTCREVAQDCINDNKDNEEFDLGQVAFDLAESLLYNNEILDYLERKIGLKSKRVMKEYLADSIYV